MSKRGGVLLGVWVSPTQMQLFSRAAEREALSKSSWARRALVAALAAAEK
jgi:hypothetical protein